MREYELIDKTDNDCHDTGEKSMMQSEADVRNRDYGYERFIVKPLGWSARNFKG